MIHHNFSPTKTTILRSNTFGKKRSFRMQIFQQLLIISYCNFLNKIIYSGHLLLMYKYDIIVFIIIDKMWS